ncbi:MAG: hypothetical protein VYC65_04600 [Chloroflexota bacterium]|nr:hypothetical protein [Chloroflexota bacterium]MQG37164.1 hypothetical protein [SAR202 cluster bacterium]|tara:strand:- start:38925 stop:39605 length:681 start_codon:yes stop_codon:yes gene_type:complete
MSQSNLTGNPQLRTMFPDYWRLDSLVRAEVTELDNSILDWTSDRWSWSGWSIRQQTSHMASIPIRWLIGKWADQLFPYSIPMTPERYAIFDSQQHDRRLDDQAFWCIDEILSALDEALSISKRVLIDTTIKKARTMVVYRVPSDEWELMRTVHPDGISLDPATGTMTCKDLVATFRHIQNEFYTHIFNIQRAKIALGIEPIVKLPDAGYHKATGWDSKIPGWNEAH